MKFETDNPTKISLKDFTGCLIHCTLTRRDITTKSWKKEIALLGIYSSEYRIFVNEIERDENDRKENGKKKHKQYPPYKEKRKIPKEK